MDMQHLAKLGARIRLDELRKEQAALTAFIGADKPAPAVAQPKRHMSQSARRKIAAAQKARWALKRAEGQ